MRCWKSARLDARLARVLLLLALAAGPMLGRSEPAELEELRVERTDGELFLFAQDMWLKRSRRHG